MAARHGEILPKFPRPTHIASNVPRRFGKFVNNMVWHTDDELDNLLKQEIIKAERAGLFDP